ncbi:MAG: alanine--tRNA ligase, partial [Thaumarchaeota archaeon]|nr:alanine--tRNA ligase [Nitrososphaerota archaeon]
VPRVGEMVEGEVDMERRLAIMRHHTATHIILGAARKALGKHAWQAGARKEPSFGRLDISHHRRLTNAEVERIEEEANRIVAARIPVKTALMDRNEAEARYGFQLYQGGEVPSAVIRVVEIPGWDAEACAGLHVENTEDVGLIKIIRTERIQDGVERLVFAAGPALLPYVQEEWKRIRLLAEKLGAPIGAAEKRLDEILSELKALRRLVRKLTASAARFRAMELKSSPIRVDEKLTLYVTHEPEAEREYVLTIADELLGVEEPACLIAAYGDERPSLLILANRKAIESGVHAGKLSSAIASRLGGKGGGKERLGQGGLGRKITYEELKTVAVDELRKFLGSR